MDLLFSKYASPFVLLDEMLFSNRLSDFVCTVAEKENDRKLWQMYLSLLSNPYSEVGSFNEFKHNNGGRRVDEKINLEETINSSFEIVNNFNPEL